MLVASATVKIHATGRTKVTIHLTVAGRRLLRRVKRVKLTSRVSFTAGSQSGSVAGTFTLAA